MMSLYQWRSSYIIRTAGKRI